MTLQDVANYVQIFGILTVVIVGGVFGLIQFREFRRQRRDAITAELMRTFYSVDLADTATLIRSLPDHCNAAELRRRGPQYERAAVIISTSFETIGLLVLTRSADFETATRLAGGMVVVLWRKLDSWLASVREEQRQPSWAEWFQWLAEQAATRKDETRPA